MRQILHATCDELTRAGAPIGKGDVERELEAVRGECERLAEAIARGGPLDALLARVQAKQTRMRELETVRKAPSVPIQTDTRAGWERRLRAKLAGLRELLRSDVAEARAILGTSLCGPLRFTPAVEDRRRGYRFEGAIALDRVVSGIVELPTKMASPAFASWNHLERWLRAVDGLRQAA